MRGYGGLVMLFGLLIMFLMHKNRMQYVDGIGIVCAGINGWKDTLSWYLNSIKGLMYHIKCLVWYLMYYMIVLFEFVSMEQECLRMSGTLNDKRCWNILMRGIEEQCAAELI